MTLTSCAGFTFTLLDQLRELFNQFSLFIVRLSTVKLSVYQSISCLHLSISYVSVFHQLDAKISVSCVCVIRSVVNIIPSDESNETKLKLISCMHNSGSVVFVLVNQLETLSD